MGTSSFVKIMSLVILISLTACGDKLLLRQSDFYKMSGWHDDNQAEALVSFKKSCTKFRQIPDSRPFHDSGVGGKFRDWQKLCEKADIVDNADSASARKFFENNFTPYLATNWGRDDGTFTGYYEIELKGSHTKHGAYKYPLYKRPDDLKDGQRYYSRKEIEDGALKGRGLEFAWVDDPVRLFFLHVQGSGRIKMEDGSVLRVGYNGKNNRKYTSIGRNMIDAGYIKEEDMSAQAIKKWLYGRPDKVASVLNNNESYVFFRQIGEDGPIGGQGVPLTPMRSLAVDKRFVPYGAPVWVDVALNGQSQHGQSLKKLLIAQDTGSAIKGPVRGDVFFGHGDEAEHLAGYQNNKGRYFILLPRESL